MAHNGHLSRSRVFCMSAPRRIMAWMAVLSLLVQVLVPFGQALAFDPETDIEYQIICTANGVKQIALDADGAPIEPQDARTCPFCFLTAAPVLLNPGQGQVLVSLEESRAVTFDRLSPQRHASIWRGAPQPSRAPPFTA